MPSVKCSQVITMSKEVDKKVVRTVQSAFCHLVKTAAGTPLSMALERGAAGNHNPMLKRARSRLHGYGVFATVDIAPNTPIMVVRGTLIPNTSHQSKREAAYTWCLPGGDHGISQLAVSSSNKARYINSSVGSGSRATAKLLWMCGGKVAVLYSGSRTIRANTEITIRYKV